MICGDLPHTARTRERKSALALLIARTMREELASMRTSQLLIGEALGAVQDRKEWVTGGAKLTLENAEAKAEGECEQPAIRDLASEKRVKEELTVSKYMLS